VAREMMPWNAEAVEWDDGNESELAAHGVTPIEVEDLFAEGPTWVPNKRHRAGNWKMVGYTPGSRALTVVVVSNDVRRTLRPVTGWDCTPDETAKYLRGRGR
jgi:uncharacterized DUF497 family protein